MSRDIITFDSTEFSDEAEEKLRGTLKTFGLFLYNLEKEVYGQSESDSYFLVISDRKLSKEQLKGIMDGE